MCEVCGAETPFLCSVCSCVSYCSERCQIEDWSMHKLICKDEHMALLRKTACELCESHFTPLFEVRQDPSTNNAYWHMTNASGSINFSLTSDMRVTDLARRFALLHQNQDEECGICFENNKEVSCHKCGERHCYECYICLFEAGHGVITCPFCRTSTGHKMTSQEVVCGISQIKHKVNELKKMRKIQEEKKRQIELTAETADNETASKKAERQRQRRKAKKKRVAAAKASQHATKALEV